MCKKWLELPTTTTTRIVEKFLYFPLKLKGIRKWLVKAKIKQKSRWTRLLPDGIPIEIFENESFL